jgi:glycosyltransferase involved in cell wall biosynthesis
MANVQRAWYEGTKVSLEKATSIVTGKRKRDAAVRDYRRRIQEVRAQQGAVQAVPYCRAAVTAHPHSAELWYLYGRVLLDANRRIAAVEAFGLALQREPSHLLALEYFVEASRGKRGERSNPEVVGAIDKLSDVVTRPGVDVLGALDFLIPHRRTEALQLIAEGRFGQASEAAKLALELGTAGNGPGSVVPVIPEQGLTSKVVQRRWAIVLLGRGRYSSAVGVLESMKVEDRPGAAIRRAARRSLASNKPESAIPILTLMQQARPHDEWVAKRLSELNAQRYSNYALGKRGFPLPKVSEEAAYEPDQAKVLYLLHNSLPHHSAGYATRTHGLLSELNRSQYNVEGLTRLGYPYDMPGREGLGIISATDVVDNVSYSHLSTSPGLELKKPLYEYIQRYSDSLEAYARKNRPAIIHAASNHWNGLAAVTAANRLGLPSVYEVRGLWEVTRGSRNPEWAKGGMYRLIARMEADAARGATQVLTITNALKDEMVRRGVDEAKITVVPNGVDTRRFQPIERDVELLRELRLEGKTVIGYIGSVLDYEGLELLLYAAESLKKTRSDFHVLIVGDGAELERFKSISNERGLDDTVTFTGRVPHADVERYYSIVDIAPFPRLPLPVCEMVSPLKPFEAMAMGKAVVASDVGALSEIVQHEKTGLLHKKGSAADLTRVLDNLLESPRLRQQLADNGLSWVRSERDWAQIAHRVIGVYDNLLLPSAAVLAT